VAAGWNENRAIFDTRFAKTQHGDGASPKPATHRVIRHMIELGAFSLREPVSTPDEPVSTPDQVRGRLSLENALFDRNDEASNQPCDFVQMFGIMFRNGSRQPDQTLIITQGRDVAGYDRRNRPDENGLGVGHGITFRKTGHVRTSSVNRSFWRSVRGAKA
jgi:hypothetical protein